MATSNAFSRKVWWRLANFLVTRYLYVVSLEPGYLVSHSSASSVARYRLASRQ